MLTGTTADVNARKTFALPLILESHYYCSMISQEAFPPGHDGF